MGDYYYERLEKLIKELKYLNRESFKHAIRHNNIVQIHQQLDLRAISQCYYQAKTKLNLLHENLQCYRREKSLLNPK